MIPIYSKHGNFQLQIDPEDLHLVQIGLHVAKQRQKNGTICLVPRASKNGFNRRNSDMRHVHILVAEKVLGRSLKKIEVVHHLNGNVFDDRRSNLLILKNSEHGKLHMQMSKEYAREHFESLSHDRALQLIERLLSCKCGLPKRILRVIG